MAKKKRSLFFRESEDSSTDSSTNVLDILGGSENTTITKDEALNIPSLAGAVNFISSTIAMLPIELKRYDGKKANPDDVRIALLNGVTGDTLDAFQMKKAWIEDMILKGKGYIYINHLRNTVKSLHYVQESKVTVMENTDPIFKDYDIMVNGIKYRDFEFLKLTRKTVNGVTGKGIIDENNKMLSVAYNSLEFENNLVQSGGKKGFLQTDRKVAESAINKIKSAWKRFYSKNSDNIMVLNDGLKFTEASLSSVEMQLKENKEANSVEICKILNLSPEIINGTCSDEEYNNGIKTAILPVIKAIETALNKDLLLESEYKSLYFAVDTKPLLKGDIQKRYAAYAIGIKNNFMQLDDVREMEGMSPLGINFVKLGLNDVLYYPETGKVYTPNTGKTAEVDNLKGGDDE